MSWPRVILWEELQLKIQENSRKQCSGHERTKMSATAGFILLYQCISQYMMEVVGAVTCQGYMNVFVSVSPSITVHGAEAVFWGAVVLLC